MGDFNNTHLEGLALSPCSRSPVNTAYNRSISSFGVVEVDKAAFA